MIDWIFLLTNELSPEGHGQSSFGDHVDVAEDGLKIPYTADFVLTVIIWIWWEPLQKASGFISR